jgi:deoxyribonuclease IV
MNVGAHVPTRGRPANAIEYAERIGADAFQIFVGNPRAWAPPPIRTDLIDEFHERRAWSAIRAAFVHASYLVNIASPTPDFRERSVALARAELSAAAALGADGLVVHAGAGGVGHGDEAVRRAAESVLRIADAVEGAMVLLELTAGGAGTVASTLPQAAHLILDAAGGDARLGLCLDTCHLFAAGYGLDTDEGVDSLVDELRRLGLAERLRLIHANDARDPRGSRRDRHADPGRGHIGQDGFRALFAEPVIAPLTALAEVPGREEAHRRVVTDLRRLAGG